MQWVVKVPKSIRQSDDGRQIIKWVGPFLNKKLAEHWIKATFASEVQKDFKIERIYKPNTSGGV